MVRWLLALAAIGFAPSASAAELEYLRGSATPAYNVPQAPPPLPAFAAPPPLPLAGLPGAANGHRGETCRLELDRILLRGECRARGHDQQLCRSIRHLRVRRRGAEPRI